MNFFQPRATTTSSVRPDNIKLDSFPDVDKILFVASDSEKYPREELREMRESAPSSIRHILFPSRSPPPATKNRLKEKAKIPSLALVIDGLAAVKISPANYSTGSPPKRSFRQTLHRRNKHVFVSSHSPTKSKSSSPSKTRSIRKRHRRHNVALNAKDFESLLKME